MLITLGTILWAQGDAVAAYDALTEALRFARAVGPRLFAALALEGLASVVVSQGGAELAARLLAGASALRAQMGTPVRPVDQADVERTLATARSALGEDAFAAVWAEAQTRSLEQILSTHSSVAVFNVCGRSICRGAALHCAARHRYALNVRVVLPSAYVVFDICGDMRRVVEIEGMRVLIVEGEPYLAEAIRDGLRLAAIAADIASDGDTALELLSINAYDIAVLDRDSPSPSGDEIAKRIVASGGGMPILMLTCRRPSDDKATGFELGADVPHEAVRTPRTRAPPQSTQPQAGLTATRARDRKACVWIRSAARSTATVAMSR